MKPKINRNIDSYLAYATGNKRGPRVGADLRTQKVLSAVRMENMQRAAAVLGMVLISACSFHPARRVPTEEIAIERISADPLSIGEAKTYVDNDVLCVEGVVNSSQGEHSNNRGTVSVTVIAKSGETLERQCGAFYSSETRLGSHLHRQHEHSVRRFDVRLKSRIDDISKLIVMPLAADVECPTE